MGAADGSIIAADIVSQNPTYQPNVPRSVPGPPSIPCIHPASTGQSTSATTSRMTTGSGTSTDRRGAVSNQALQAKSR